MYVCAIAARPPRSPPPSFRRAEPRCPLSAMRSRARPGCERRANPADRTVDAPLDTDGRRQEDGPILRIAATGLLLLDWRTGGKPGQLRTQVSRALDRIGAHEEARHIRRSQILT